tara:strand:- start:9436 stop:9879 length:444 start_codon:yes stop_codon:yes gene_type:complete
MRKNTLFVILMGFLSASLHAQEPTDIIGYWLNEKADAKIEIYQKENIFEGKIVWMIQPKDENGNWKLDSKNPNENLRNRKKIGLKILHNLKWDADQKEWNSGKIYNSREGDTYSLFAKIQESNTLNLRGFIGFSLFGKTTVWKRCKL